MKLGEIRFTMLALAVLSAAMLVGSVSIAAAQDEFGARQLKFGVEPLEGGDMDQILQDSVQAKGLRMWSYTVTSLRNGSEGTNYTGVMVGRSPFSTNTSTTTTVYVVPLITTIGSATFDPTVADSCIGGKVPLTVLKNSPMVKASHDFHINGVDVGKAQYGDAFQRANFWSFVSAFGGTYHNKLKYVFLPAVTFTPDPSVSTLYSTGNPCSPQYGGLEKSAFAFIAKFLLIPYAQSFGAGPNSLPMILLYNTTMYDTTPSNCCIGGYHGAYGSPVQTYTPVGFDTAGFYGPDATDTLIMSHEINEWQDDPLGNNITPAWGHVGQVKGCQDNLEVGDPLTPINRPTVTMNGFTYHLQELAFFSWFYGGIPYGAGGLYSDNGTFTAPQGPCT